MNLNFVIGRLGVYCQVEQLEARARGSEVRRVASLFSKGREQAGDDIVGATTITSSCDFCFGHDVLCAKEPENQAGAMALIS